MTNRLKLWLPSWPAPPSVKAVFTTRHGGVSLAPFDSFNLGDHVGDAPAAVTQNRDRLAREIAARPVFLQQVHGVAVADLDQAVTDGTEADACISSEVGRACTIMVADCLPVLFAHRTLPVVAAAHAGWRGLAGAGGHGVLEAAFAAFVARCQRFAPGAETASVAADTLVWLGPCIGPEAFEVGEPVRDAFVGPQPLAAASFKPLATPGQYWADLPGLARLRLAQMGLHQVFGNDGSRDWCTVSRPFDFFSHRRDAARLGCTGRMAARIWRV